TATFKDVGAVSVAAGSATAPVGASVVWALTSSIFMPSVHAHRPTPCAPSRLRASRGRLLGHARAPNRGCDQALRRCSRARALATGAGTQPSRPPVLTSTPRSPCLQSALQLRQAVCWLAVDRSSTDS